MLREGGRRKHRRERSDRGAQRVPRPEQAGAFWLYGLASARVLSFKIRWRWKMSTTSELEFAFHFVRFAGDIGQFVFEGLYLLG